MKITLNTINGKWVVNAFDKTFIFDSSDDAFNFIGGCRKAVVM